MDLRSYPYTSLFRKYVSDLGPPDGDGWSTGTCPFCGEADTFRVNLQSGRWVCLPAPQAQVGKSERHPKKSVLRQEQNGRDEEGLR